jgi:hypothetical protein
MNTPKAMWGDQINGGARLRRTLSFVLASIRITLYGVLAVLRPLIVVALAVFCVVGVLLSLFYGLLVHGSHFPLLLVLGLSVGSALLIVVYQPLMDLLRPQ